MWLFCRKRFVKTRHLMGLRHPGRWDCLWMHFWCVLQCGCVLIRVLKSWRIHVWSDTMRLSVHSAAAHTLKHPHTLHPHTLQRTRRVHVTWYNRTDAIIWVHTHFVQWLRSVCATQIRKKERLKNAVDILFVRVAVCVCCSVCVAVRAAETWCNATSSRWSLCVHAGCVCYRDGVLQCVLQCVLQWHDMMRLRVNALLCAQVCFLVIRCTRICDAVCVFVLQCVYCSVCGVRVDAHLCTALRV